MTTPTSSSIITRTTSSPTASCTTAVPGKYGYVPPDACNAQWLYAPSFAAAIAFCTLFALLTLAHLGLAIIYRKRFSWPLIMGLGWEFGSFLTRAMGAHNQQSQTYAFTSTLLFLLAPLWINAYVYMTAGRMIWMFHPEKQVWKLKAVSLAKYFVWLDVFSFLIQVIGGTMLSPGASADTMKLGKNIYMTGIGIQQLFICLFFALIVRFQLEVRRFERAGLPSKGPRWQWVTFALYAVLVLITMRIIFRLDEFAAGTSESNPLPYHEKYALALDAFPMTLAGLILALVHPGLALKGPESEFPSRKEIKAEKKRVKAEKKALKQERKRGFPTGYTNVRSDVELNHV